MDTSFFTRAYLETLSSSELLSIGDDYGIDIPADLNRNFIIAELLAAAEDTKQDDNVLLHEMGCREIHDEQPLPASYNETSIDMVLRNPVCAFVFWDVSEADLARLQESGSFIGLKLSVIFYEHNSGGAVVDSFDVQVGLQDREQFVLLPAGHKGVAVSLLAEFISGKKELLCETQCVPVPEIFTSLEVSFPAALQDMPELHCLSGKGELLRSHFESHRQAFSSRI